MLALQERIQGGAPVDHPEMLWPVEHAGELLAEQLVGRDGRTAFERLFGKRGQGNGYEFGEQVFSVLVRATWAEASAPGGAT
eukprot:13490573-Alexandrium_andersonii.AAC.1